MDFNQFMMDPRAQSLLGLGAGLLQAAGPSPRPVSTGQALSQGLLGLQAGYQSAIQHGLLADRIEEKKREKEAKKKLAEAIGTLPQEYIPGAGQGMLENREGTGYLGGKIPIEGLLATAAQNNPEVGLGGLVSLEKQRVSATGGGEAPAAVKEWEYLKKQFPDMKMDFPTYLSVKRSGYTVGDIGGVPSMRPSIPGLPVIPLSTLPTEVGGKSAIAAGVKAAEVGAGAQTQAQIDLGSNLDEINKMREEVKGLVNSKGFDYIYGLARPLAHIPGSAPANSEARREQLEAASFGIAIQKMRGLGQLSDAEGKKATAAYTRAINTKQSPAAAKEAWGEVQKYLDLAEIRAKQKAGASTSTRNPILDKYGIKP